MEKIMGNFEQQFEKRKKALDEGKYPGAFQYLLTCAEAGNAEAQASVGFLYYMGLGVDRDLQGAIGWLTKAVAQGRGEAAHNLATLYLTCEPELPNNQEESRRLYLKAKELGFIVAPDEWYEKLK
jgi:TPR repeat protein